MKQFLFLTILCTMFATASQAQKTSLTIVNNTGLTVYFRVGGDVASGTCSYTYFSNIITLGPVSSVTYADPTAVPGGVNCGSCTPGSLGASDYFYAIELLHNGPGCGGAPTAHLGEPCGFINMHGGFHVEDATCNFAGIINMASYDSVTGTLTFN